MKRTIIIGSIALGIVILFAAYYVATPFLFPAGRTLRLDLQGLPGLARGHYEGWAIYGDEKVSTGKFRVSGSGLVSLSGEPITEFRVDRDLRAADAIAVTIEADGDTDNLPSGILILFGEVTNGRAALRFPFDLSGSSAQYVLATPTNGDDPKSEETSGVWFPDLKLPAAPSGWKYEGWAVHKGNALSTGRFVNPAAPDEFSGYSGPQSGPPVPGEDFLVNAPTGITFPIDLADGESVIAITIEPDLNGVDPTGPLPFDLKPFVAMVLAGAIDHQPYTIQLDLSSFPTAIATIP
jgi:hypothetical protein